MTDQGFSGSLRPGTKLGKYEVREQVATGGMAVIYKAYDPSLDRMVAIKQIAPNLAQDERFIERFRAEAQTLAKLSSSQANIVNVHELIQKDGQLFLVMEFVEGTTLRVLMDRGPVPLQTGLGVLLSTALGLKAMHGQGIVHRDLTPSNIMMARDGALKITDFGLIGHTGGKTSLPMGTTKYMAPEMFTGVPVDARADIYSLGMIAYEMFAGPDKFSDAFKDVLRDERAQQVRWMHWHSNPGLKAPALKDLQPGVPPLVIKIIDRMMEKDPSKRFASADQIIRWLRRIFVMHVQGKSLSVSDSEALEKELAAETSGSAVAVTKADRSAPPSLPPVRPGGGTRVVPAGAAAAVVPARAPGSKTAALEAPATPTTEKTAPLPKPKLTWKQAAIWATVILVPLVVAGAGIVIWNNMKVEGVYERAKVIRDDADSQFRAKEYANAIVTYQKLSQYLSESSLHDARLDEILRYSHQREWMSKAEDSLKGNHFDDADRFITEAGSNGAATDWRDEIRNRLLNARDIDTGQGKIKALEAAGDFDAALSLAQDLQNRHPDQKQIADWIARIKREKDEGADELFYNQAASLVSKGDKVSLEQARQILHLKIKKTDAPKVVSLKGQIDRLLGARGLWEEGQKLQVAGRWDEAAAKYKMLVDSSKGEPALANYFAQASVQYNICMASSYAAKARAMQENPSTAGDAYNLWREVLKYDPSNAEARGWVTAFEQQEQKLVGLKAARAAYDAHKWDEAIQAYKELIPKLDPTADAAVRREAEERITNAGYQTHMDLGLAAFAANDMDTAEKEFLAAQIVKDTDEVKQKLADVEKQRQYLVYAVKAKQSLAEKNFMDAIKYADQAIAQVPTAEMAKVKNEAYYGVHFKKAYEYWKEGSIREALGRANIAKGYDDTAEVEGLITILKAALASKGEE
jgi:serine/threonine protein kinase/tetratricopeptide (TPR) repeat protein